MDVKFNTYRGGHYFFNSFSQTGKVVEELLEHKYLCLLTLELNWENIKSGVLISELADLVFSYLSSSEKGMPLLYIKTVLLYWHQFLMKQETLRVVKAAL